MGSRTVEERLTRVEDRLDGFGDRLVSEATRGHDAVRGLQRAVWGVGLMLLLPSVSAGVWLVRIGAMAEQTAAALTAHLEESGPMRDDYLATRSLMLARLDGIVERLDRMERTP